MSGAVTIVGGTSLAPANYTNNNTPIDLTTGYLLVTGSGDSVVSSASNVGVTMTASNNLISVTDSGDVITAGVSFTNPQNNNNLFVGGDNNTITDYGYNNGGVTINGSGNSLLSYQTAEHVNMVLNGSNNTISALYMNANMVINGNYEVVNVGSGNFTVNGRNDTVTTLNAKTILVAGLDNTILNEAIPGQSNPTNIFGGNGSTTTPGTAITVTGAGANVTSLNNNDTVTSTGAQAKLALLSYNNTVFASGGGTVVNTQSTSETVSIAGANSTVSTSSLVPVAPSIPGSSVTFAGNASVGAIYNAGSSVVTDPSTSGTPITVNVTTSHSSVIGSAGETINDLVGGNFMTISGAETVSVITGNDTIQVSDNTQITQDTLSGASGPNVINFGSNDQYIGAANNAVSSLNVLMRWTAPAPGIDVP